jgi:DNA-directed RNA polymerase specialized sigma24 family protein
MRGAYTRASRHTFHNCDPRLLTPQQSTVVAMRQEGLALRDIAVRIDRSVGAVKAVLSRARRIQETWSR